MRGIKRADSRQDAFPLQPQQCLLLAHRVSAGTSQKRYKPTNKVLSKCALAHTSLDQDPEAIKNEFDGLLASVYTFLMDRKELDEANILK